jgi:hypothetical protein
MLSPMRHGASTWDAAWDAPGDAAWLTAWPAAWPTAWLTAWPRPGEPPGEPACGARGGAPGEFSWPTPGEPPREPPGEPSGEPTSEPPWARLHHPRRRLGWRPSCSSSTRWVAIGKTPIGPSGQTHTPLNAKRRPHHLPASGGKSKRHVWPRCSLADCPRLMRRRAKERQGTRTALKTNIQANLPGSSGNVVPFPADSASKRTCTRGRARGAEPAVHTAMHTRCAHGHPGRNVCTACARAAANLVGTPPTTLTIWIC